MGSPAAPDPALPIIDISPYLSSSSSSGSPGRRKEVADALHRACRDVGFFYLDVSSFVSCERGDEILRLGREFFHRPQEEKDAIHLDHSDGVRGYQKLRQNITLGKADHHEGLDMYAPSPYPSRARPQGEKLIPLEGENQWPLHPPDFRSAMERWVRTMKDLGMLVVKAMCDGLGLDNAEWEELRGQVDDSFWVFRVIGYPPLPGGAEGVSCGEHKDYGCLTFLLADPTPNALQVLSRSGEWLNADPIPGCLVVNIGEMWDRWTGGLYPATLHRVVHRSPTYRVSAPFFFEPNFEALIKLLPAARRKAAEEGRELRDAGEIKYGDFLISKVSGNFKY